MTTDRNEIMKACLMTLDAFMAALNAYDAAAMDGTMHFPHVRFAQGDMKVYQAPGHNPMDLFDRLRREDDWAWSEWRERALVQHSADKAHVMLSYVRFRRDGTEIGTYTSLYVLTLRDGRWGIQMRSSFGP